MTSARADLSVPRMGPPLPPGLSTFAPEVDALYAATLAFCGGLALMIAAALVGAALRAGPRRQVLGRGGVPGRLWSLAPLPFLVWVFVVGFEAYRGMTMAPAGSHVVRVRAAEGHWEFEHAGGVIDDRDELKVPVGDPVKLLLSSSDALTTFFVPALRVKQDALPGRFSSLWFRATRTTPYTAETECATDADCGPGHHCGRLRTLPVDLDADQVLMGERGEREGTREARYCTPSILGGAYGRAASVAFVGDAGGADLRVLPLRGYEEFLLGPPGCGCLCCGAEDPMLCWGEAIYRGSGCIGCHGNDGERTSPAPNFRGLWGATRTFEAGYERVADAAYIRQSVLRPQSQIVRGYGHVNMPAYRFSDRQLGALVAYIRSLGVPSGEAERDDVAARGQEAGEVTDDLIGVRRGHLDSAR